MKNLFESVEHKVDKNNLYLDVKIYMKQFIWRYKNKMETENGKENKNENMIRIIW